MQHVYSFSQYIKEERFEAYHGRYEFDVDKAYDLINKGQVKYTIQTIAPERNFMSMQSFTQTDPNKIRSIGSDFNEPIGIIVKLKDPETEETEWLLIDGNHRTRKAIELGKFTKYYLISDPADVQKFMEVNHEIPHQELADEVFEKKKRLKWHDSDAPDANGKFKKLGVQKLADWLIRTRGGNMQKITGSLNQQIAFNKKKNPAYAKKMESTREAVKRKLKKG